MESIRICVLVLSFVFICVIAQDQDWCSIPGCLTNHIACNNNGNFHDSCVNPSQVVLTEALKEQIVQVHNELRNRIALGDEPRFSPARRMAQIVWNDELAFLAELNTRQCRMAHDACRNTKNFTYSGQNLGASGITLGHYQPEYVVNNTITRWYNEHPYATQSDIDLLTRIYNEDNNAIGHFTAVVGERQTAVGCAISRYNAAPFYWSLMACNYASANMLQRPVYRSGVAASYCSLGRDPTFPGLCTTNEPINPNSFD